MYRQISRRRYKKNINPKIFEKLMAITNKKSTTIEAFNNYRDIFMTSEVINVLNKKLNTFEDTK